MFARKKSRCSKFFKNVKIVFKGQDDIVLGVFKGQDVIVLGYSKVRISNVLGVFKVRISIVLGVIKGQDCVRGIQG